jgi:hypothetical protein
MKNLQNLQNELLEKKFSSQEEFNTWFCRRIICISADLRSVAQTQSHTKRSLQLLKTVVGLIL